MKKTHNLARRGLLPAAILTCLAGVPYTEPVFARQLVAATDIRLELKIAAGSLASALNQLANEAGLALTYMPDLVAGKTTPGLRGRFTVEQALQQLLKGSRLEYRFFDGNMVTLERIQEAPTSGPIALTPITVEGEKFARSLQDTLSSVVVFTDETISESVITDIEEAVRRVPNVNLNSGGEGLVFRGIPQQGLGNGTFDPVSPTSAIYIDGAVQSQAGAVSGVLSTWDVDQIEVFRGPQTATQGRSGLAGSLVVKTADPTFEWNAKARTIFTDDSRRQYAVAGGGPLVDDVLAFRIAVESAEDDGYTTFDFNGSKSDSVGRNDRDLVRAKVLFTPTYDLEALLTLTHADAERGVNTVSGPDFFDNRTTERINIRETDVLTGSLELSYQVNDAMTLQSVTAFTDLEEDGFVDPATVGGTGLAIPSEGDDSALTQELRLTYDAGGVVRGLAGIYYADIEETFERTITGFALGSQLFRNDGFEKSFDNIAVFGQIEYDVSPQWTFLLGGRFEYEENSSVQFSITDLTPDVPGFTEGANFFKGDGSESAFLPKAGVTYNFSEDTSLSFTFQRSYRPGGTDDNPGDNSAVRFDPEFTNNFDLAFRSEFANGKGTLNANLFYIDYKDQQIRVTPDPTLTAIRFVDNAGDSKMYGLELDARYRPDSVWSFYGALGLLQTEFKEFSVGGVDASGDEFPLAPNVSISLGGTWRHPTGWNGSLDVIHTGGYTSFISAEPVSNVDAFTLVDGRFGYRADHWEMYVFAENIFDENYVTDANRSNADPALWTATLGRPRSIGVALQVEF